MKWIRSVVEIIFLSNEELSALNSLAKTASIKKFDSEATFGNKEYILLTRRELEDTVQQEYQTYIKTNKFKMQAGLERFIIPVISAIVAFILDSISDWTCDAWSQTCRSFSRLMAIVYYIVFSVMGYEFYKVYRKQGTTAVGISAMGLGQTIFQRIEEYRHSLASVVTRQGDKENKKKTE